MLGQHRSKSGRSLILEITLTKYEVRSLNSRDLAASLLMSVIDMLVRLLQMKDERTSGRNNEVVSTNPCRTQDPFQFSHLSLDNLL